MERMYDAGEKQNTHKSGDTEKVRNGRYKGHQIDEFGG